MLVGEFCKSRRGLFTLFKASCCFSLLYVPGAAIGQQAPPPPPQPPVFMTMRGFPLSCFEKPKFEEDGLEFFVCNGGGGLAGVRKKTDPAHTVFVRDEHSAQNLNMQKAKAACGKGRFAVRSDANGVISFECQGEELKNHETFRAASKVDWKKYATYLN
jgi:hypothetical protein